MLIRIAIFALSLIPSGLWMLYAIFVSGSPADGQRGGAVGTILALIFVVITRSYAMEVFVADRNQRRREAREQAEASDSNPKPPSIQELAADFDGLLDAIETDAIDQKNLNLCLVIASGISALIWGFGDQFVAPFIASAPCAPH